MIPSKRNRSCHRTSSARRCPATAPTIASACAQASTAMALVDSACMRSARGLGCVCILFQPRASACVRSGRRRAGAGRQPHRSPIPRRRFNREENSGCSGGEKRCPINISSVIRPANAREHRSKGGPGQRKGNGIEQPKARPAGIRRSSRKTPTVSNVVTPSRTKADFR